MFVMALSNSAMACSAAWATICTSLRGWPSSKLSTCSTQWPPLSKVHTVQPSLWAPPADRAALQLGTAACCPSCCMSMMQGGARSGGPAAHLWHVCGWRKFLGQAAARAHELQDALCLQTAAPTCHSAAHPGDRLQTAFTIRCVPGRDCRTPSGVHADCSALHMLHSPLRWQDSRAGVPLTGYRVTGFDSVHLNRPACSAQPH